jgi:2-methylcitrate dehydratase PrpD
MFPVAQRRRAAAAGDLAQRIGKWSRQASLSPERLARIRASIQDFVGCVVAGTRRAELRPALWLAHGGGVPVWGLADSFDAAGAALVAGTAGSLLQLHDFYGPGGSHPSAPVIAAAWSALHSLGAGPTASFVPAVAAGYEVANRMADACMPGQILAGSTPTATSGAFGAAVAAALIGGLDAAGVGRAVCNAALLLSAAPIAAMRAHGSLVPLHAGLAARAGYEAALLARDADAGTQVLEGDRHGPGLISLLGGDARRIEPDAWNGETIDAVGWKFIPACFGSHVALEAVLRMEQIDPACIQRVVVRQSARLLDVVVESGPVAGDPEAVDAAAATTALAAKIEIEHDPLLDASLPHTLCACIEVHTRTGVRRIDYRRPSKGDPESPGPRGWSVTLDPTSLLRKFEALVEGNVSTPEILAAMGIPP